MLWKATKITLREDPEIEYVAVPVGFSITGEVSKEHMPTPGQCFMIGGFSGLRTSPVDKIVHQEENRIIFKTLNSYYSLEKVTDGEDN